MIFNVQEKDGVKIAEFADLRRFTLAVTEDVKSELKPVLNEKGSKLVLNLENIEFIDSSGIGCIISLVKTAKSAGTNIKLCNLQKQVVDVFELLHLNMILDVEKDLDSAVKCFNNN